MANLQAGKGYARALYLFLPRNGRMILISHPGEPLPLGLLEELSARPNLELWAREVTAELGVREASSAADGAVFAALLSGAEAAGFAAVSDEGKVLEEKQANDLRDEANAACLAVAEENPLLKVVLEFRAGQSARAHSVLVGSVSQALASAAGFSEPAFLGEILIAATFHDVAYPFAGATHPQAALDLIDQSEFSLAKNIRQAIQDHHATDVPAPGSLARFLGLAEKFVDFRARPKGKFGEFLNGLSPADAELFRPRESKP